MYDDLQYNVGKMWKAVTEDPTGNLHVQMLKDAGRIDPDAIVESTPVQYARNANFAFRMVFNPLMDTMENTANAIDYVVTGDTTPAMRRGQDEVGFAERTGQKLAAPTYDFAGDKEYVEKYGLTSAWLSEALLEQQQVEHLETTLYLGILRSTTQWPSHLRMHTKVYSSHLILMLSQVPSLRWVYL